MVAVYRVGLKTKPHLKNSVLRIFSIMGAMVLLEFRFLCVLGGLQTPKTVCKGGLDKVTPALQVVIVSHLLGNTREMATA